MKGIEYIAKSGEGLRMMVKAIRAHKHLAMLVDQKLNQGIPVPFFGRTAMTAPAIAQLALKYDVPVVPAKMERLRGAYFRITLFAPMSFTKTGDVDQDVAATMRRINALFEEWIREHPDHWLWIHRRWPQG
jgi:KDO2-lipid IV(A) lauroyltransferase